MLQSPDDAPDSAVRGITIVAGTDRLRDVLEVLVPFVGDACAFDRVAPDGARVFVAGVGLDDEQEAALADVGLRASPTVRVTVAAFARTIGELSVWSQQDPSAVEEALIHLTAERIGDLVESEMLPEAPLFIG